MAHDDLETTYERLPLIVRIFETIREVALFTAMWLLLLVPTLMIAIGIVQLLF